MQLMLWTTLNRRYFAKGSRPSQREWEAAVLEGRVNGKIAFNTVFIDIDDFLSRDDFQAVSGSDGSAGIDLLE